MLQKQDTCADEVKLEYNSLEKYRSQSSEWLHTLANFQPILVSQYLEIEIIILLFALTKKP